MQFGLKSFFVFAFVSLILIGLASAQLTVVVGKLYKSDNTNSEINGQKVTVTCNGVTKEDTTKDDSTYIVSFSDEDCQVGFTVTVSADTGSYKGSSTGTVSECTGDYSECKDEQVSNFVLINPILTKYNKPSGSSGSSGSSGGSGVIVTKPVINTTATASKTAEIESINATNEETINLDDETNSTIEESDKTLKGPTGNFVLGGSTSTWLAVLLVLIVLIAIIVAVKKSRKSA